MVPESFARSLTKQLPGLRIRWSEKQRQYHIEQKVARALTPHRRISPLEDAAIRYRDGYGFVMAITQGDRTDCPKCHATTHVPVMRMKEAKCEKCGHSFRAAFFPLNDFLLEYLRYSDPYRGGIERLMAEVDKADADREQRSSREVKNEVEAATKDLATALMGIQSVGYTGREFNAS